MKNTISAVMMLGLAMFATTACDVPEQSETAEDGAEGELGEAGSAVCAYGSPPTADASVAWTGTAGYGQWVSSPSSGYGSGSCDGYVVEFTSTGTPDDLDYGSVTAYDTFTSELSCESHYASIRVFKKVLGSWSLAYDDYDVPGTWLGGEWQQCQFGLGLAQDMNLSGATTVRVWGQVYHYGLLGGRFNDRVKIGGNDAVWPYE